MMLNNEAAERKQWRRPRVNASERAGRARYGIYEGERRGGATFLREEVEINWLKIFFCLRRGRGRIDRRGAEERIKESDV